LTEQLFELNHLYIVKIDREDFMMLFLILAPFGVFAALMLIAPPLVSLFAASAVALGTIGYDIARGKSIKALAAGAAILFAAIGGYLALFDEHLSGHNIRLAVDFGMLLIALGSIALRSPFTLQYARESVEPTIAQLPAFKTINYVLTWAWTAAIALMLVANITMIYVPALPLWVGVGIAFAARNCAVYFTKWYPAHRQAKLVAQSN
jgi:hypothetical protein